MSERLPLFPLGAVLFPGLVLPLHIFEDRYKELIGDLLDGREPRQFGDIAIRVGRETGIGGVSALHEVGCTATVREVAEAADGQYDIVTVGADRFRLRGLDDSRPYLTGEIDLLDEPLGDKSAAARAAVSVQRGFRGYLNVLADRGSATINVPDLPDEPILLSYLVAASMVIELNDRQKLLAQPDAVSRLSAERALLARETAMLRELGSTPAPDLRSSPYNPN
jgi:Lon protease-like protein